MKDNGTTMPKATERTVEPTQSKKANNGHNNGPENRKDNNNNGTQAE